MNVKRFVAADMRRALELVKQEMGEDAIILSSKRVKSGVEILTSCDLPYETARESSQVAAQSSNYAALKHQRTPLHDLNGIGQQDTPLSSDDAWNWEQVMQSASDRANARGPVSGKTKQELAKEIEIARMKMEAADRVPLSELARQPNPQSIHRRTNQPNSTVSTKQPLYQPKTVNNIQPTNDLENNAPTESKPKHAVAKEEHNIVSQKPAIKKPSHFTDTQIWVSNEQEIDQSVAYDEYVNLESRKVNKLPLSASTEKKNVNGNSAEEQSQSIGSISEPSIAFAMPNYSIETTTNLSEFFDLSVDEAPTAGGENIVVHEAPMDVHNEEQFAELKSELADMRDMLHVQLERLAKSEPVPVSNNNGQTVSLSAAIKATVNKRLLQMGINPKQVSELSNTLKVRGGLAETWADGLARFAHQIPTVDKDLIASGGIFALVGPSGSGKSSTISKLATRLVLNNPNQTIAIVSFNPAQEELIQLNRLGKILDIPVAKAKDRASLTQALADFCNKDIVLIDTPSITQCGSYQINLPEMMKRLPQIDNILVLPANVQEKLQRASINEYSALPLKACVFSKVDDSLSLGELLSETIQANLPVAYFTQGQNMHGEIEVARGHQLITKAVSLLKKDANMENKTRTQKQGFQTSQQPLAAQA